MDLRISLPYNKKNINIPIPAKNLAGVITPRTTSSLKDLPQAIHNTLDHPLDSPSLEDFLQKGDKVAIIVSDITRYTGAHLFLPHLIRRITSRGIQEEKITIVFSLGIHRPMTPEVQKKIVGVETAGRILLENHNSNDENQLTSLGKTKRGTPVAINRRVAEADKVILTGTIGFHYLA
ncbi:MAG: DUF2088 domain-containing protein, partial [Deltaproteobacteria bacterium]|nr:DUF2088 domain-containing protein [Deltaproteobacteria bacterium]